MGRLLQETNRTPPRQQAAQRLWLPWQQPQQQRQHTNAPPPVWAVQQQQPRQQLPQRVRVRLVTLVQL
jgi:hypothetical protein